MNEALLEDRARELDIVATDAEVEEQIKRLKEQNKVTSEEDFVKALQGSGLTPEKLRDQLKRSTTIERVVGREVNSKVDLSDDALRPRLRARKGGLGDSRESAARRSPDQPRSRS